MLKMLEGEYGIIPGRAILPMLDKNIRCGNSLISGSPLELKKYFGDDWYKVKPFNWEEEFRKIMVEEGGFDVVIGNPPYVAHQIQNSEKVYLQSKYAESIYGRLNTYGLFIHRSAEILKSGGYFGFINPKTYLTDTYFKALRKFIKSKYKIVEIVDIKDRRSTFEGVIQAVNLLFLQRTEIAESYSILLKQVNRASDMLNKSRISELMVNSNAFFKLMKDFGIFLFSISPECYSIFEKIYKRAVFLPNITSGALTGSIQWDLYKKYFSSEKASNCRLIWAENIQRYYLQKSKKEHRWNGLSCQLMLTRLLRVILRYL
jgi:hypothetical protein